MASIEKALDSIRAAVGPKGWIGGEDGMEPYLAEQRGLFRGRCSMVVRPSSTRQVAEVVALCAGAAIPIVPQGGNTGLVGGAVPDGGIVLSLDRLARIRDLDPLNQTLTAEAGCVLANVQAAADEAGFLFPLSMGSEGSCLIGGNLATNAGGVSVLRYGTARDLVLGLEVVLADGRVLDGLRGLRKDTTGYDLKHLFIGSEGTLGVITAAVIKLFVRPRVRETALAAAPSLEALMELLSASRHAFGDTFTAFEMVPRIAMEFGLRHVPGVVDPFDAAHPYYALIELSGTGEALRGALEEFLAESLEAGHIADATIADSQARADGLWRIREAIPEAQRHEGGSIKHDLSLPISRISEFVARATRMVAGEMPGIRVVAFGHLGDGGIHFNLCQPEGADRQAFLENWERFNRMVHDLALEMGGSFSSEHGIGRLKMDHLKRYKSTVEIDLMRTLKAALDPKGIMNPGKVIEP